ncbi:Rhodanese-like protein [Emticicia oligotrophica DSM 17448]|uniref:Rhodanese-like protein n=1 Tax=Emticicia oligotrophica (strain DSM 17448 / CIP 109782 / MTCC 6937 / GPTSA100-15) TaxID=929562 RepID=A0ABM5N3W1_EMTOG|nr:MULTISPECIES: rhodanese-like domain-containing protein [Emticicia]AFK04029.1 Rhodanese-like protein [Emticicia oligotrophica DSM 17448]
MQTYTEISQSELDEVLSKPKTILVDVRENTEFADFNIGGINIPPHEITERLEELNDYQTIVVACSNGTRSSIVARLLTKKLPEKVILHLEEGIF